ncbi:MAG: hypothetical protein AAB618_02385 [Patescibacteria group bacterium]
MKKILLGTVMVAALLVAAFYALNAYIYNEKQGPEVVSPEILNPEASDYKDAEYRIEGTLVQLTDGVSVMDAAPGSSSKITTSYFGNEFMTDLNGDGREDIVFLLTQDTGGSGTFYYAVAALNLEEGYVGSDGYLLGDRIAPQSIETSPNPRHKSVVVVNYADRAVGEPMTTQPSVGKSVYLKLDSSDMKWGIVEPNFEGESW